MKMDLTLDFFPEGLEKLGRAFFARTPRLLSLDFDGTLSDIAPTPAQARLNDRFKTLLWSLSMLPQTKVAVLSGRSLPDLRKKVGIPGVILVGNHGLDFSPATIGWGLPEISDWTRRVHQAFSRLEPLVRNWPGALLEPKGLDLSLHYRLLEPAKAKRLIPEALAAIQDLPVVPHWGKSVLEIRPQGAPGKGEALERLFQRFLGRQSKWACVHVGDDQTDEDAFRFLREMGDNALGMKVGPELTLAPYRLAGTAEVWKFLNLFTENVGD